MISRLRKLFRSRKKASLPAPQPSPSTIDLILARHGGGGAVPASRSLVPWLPPLSERLMIAARQAIADRRAAIQKRRRTAGRIARILAIFAALAAATGGAYASYRTGYLAKAAAAVISLNQPVISRAAALAEKARLAFHQPAAPADAAPPSAAPATPQPAAAPAQAATSCAQEPDQDGCFVGNVVRQGAFLCADGPRPLALEFASSPLRAQVGLSHRDHVAPSTGFATILPTTTRVNYITKDIRVPLDLIAFHRDGRIAAIIPNIPPRRQMPVAVPAADGIVAIRGGEAQRLRLTEACQFAAYEEGVPMAPAQTAQTREETSNRSKPDDRRISTNSH